jgi:predicted acylesterase/phospholipase RssA
MANSTLDIVFEGGGARGLALNGATAALEEAGYGFGRLVGTSAGAITATLVAAGYSGADIRAVSFEKTASGVSRMTEFIGTPRDFTDQELLSSTLGTFFRAVDLPFVPEGVEQRADLWLLRRLSAIEGFAHVLSFVERGGLYSADGFLAWLRERLDADGRAMSGLTLGQLHARTGRHLSLVVTNTTRTGFLVLNHITAPDVPVLWAVRMSMSIPFFWPEVIWQKEWGPYRGTRDLSGDSIVDGGVVSNFALRFLVSQEEWIESIMGGPPDPETQVLGLWLDHDTLVPKAPPLPDPSRLFDLGKIHSKTLDRIERVIGSAMSASDLVELRNHEDLVCSLPTGGYGVTEFDMTDGRIEALVDAGANALKAWLARRGAPTTVSNAQQVIRSTMGGGAPPSPHNP